MARCDALKEVHSCVCVCLSLFRSVGTDAAVGVVAAAYSVLVTAEVAAVGICGELVVTSKSPLWTSLSVRLLLLLLPVVVEDCASPLAQPIMCTSSASLRLRVVRLHALTTAR